MTASRTNNELADILRAQAWEIAKGHLRAVLVTYYSDPRFERIDALVSTFIETIDGEGLAE